jgi:hypothetical protein
MKIHPNGRHRVNLKKPTMKHHRCDEQDPVAEGLTHGRIQHDEEAEWKRSVVRIEKPGRGVRNARPQCTAAARFRSRYFAAQMQQAGCSARPE